MAEVISFKFLAGANLGASLNLPPASYLLGEDSDCDLMLSGCNGAQVKLEIKENLEVWVQRLKGEVFVEGKPLDENRYALKSKEVLALGLNALAYFKEGENLQDLNLSVLGFAATAPENLESKKEEVEGQDEPQSTPTQESLKSSLKEEASLKPLEKIEEQKEEKAKPKHLFALTIIGLVVLLALLSSLVLGSYLYGERAAQNKVLSEAQAYLDNHVYDSVTVNFERGLLVFEGTLRTKAELGSFIENLPAFSNGCIFKLNLKDKKLVALEDAVIRRGGMAKAVFDDSGKNILLYGYVKDPLVERNLIKEIKEEAQVSNVVSKLTFEENLRSIIDEALNRYPLPLKFTFDDLDVIYEGELKLSDEKNLSDFKALIASKMGSYLALSQKGQKSSKLVTTIEGLGPKVTRVSQANTNFTDNQNSYTSTREDVASNPQSATPVRFEVNDVMGVTMSPMRFVTMRNGQKYFEGAILSDGSILKSISLTKLVLEKNGKESFYELN